MAFCFEKKIERSRVFKTLACIGPSLWDFMSLLSPLARWALWHVLAHGFSVRHLVKGTVKNVEAARAITEKQDRRPDQALQ